MKSVGISPVYINVMSSRFEGFPVTVRSIFFSAVHVIFCSPSSSRRTYFISIDFFQLQTHRTTVASTCVRVCTNVCETPFNALFSLQRNRCRSAVFISCVRKSIIENLLLSNARRGQTIWKMASKWVMNVAPFVFFIDSVCVCANRKVFVFAFFRVPHTAHEQFPLFNGVNWKCKKVANSPKSTSWLFIHELNVEWEESIWMDLVEARKAYCLCFGRRIGYTLTNELWQRSDSASDIFVIWLTWMHKVSELDPAQSNSYCISIASSNPSANTYRISDVSNFGWLAPDGVFNERNKY